MRKVEHAEGDAGGGTVRMHVDEAHGEIGGRLLAGDVDGQRWLAEIVGGFQ
ncbi:hypothetical protein D3C71_1961540 [compost metagenome]